VCGGGMGGTGGGLLPQGESHYLLLLVICTGLNWPRLGSKMTETSYSFKCGIDCPKNNYLKWNKCYAVFTKSLTVMKSIRT
jgi:hypothetical protein